MLLSESLVQSTRELEGGLLPCRCSVGSAKAEADVRLLQAQSSQANITLACSEDTSVPFSSLHQPLPPMGAKAGKWRAEENPFLKGKGKMLCH